MANPELLAMLRNGVQGWNNARWDERSGDLRDADLRDMNLAGVEMVSVDLTSANLTRVDLTRASLMNCNLTRASLRSSKLARAAFGDCDFSGASLTKADFSSASLWHVTLAGADLSYADLSYAALHYCDAKGCDFRGVKLQDTVFSDVDLKEATGLQDCNHIGPSVLALSTLMKSPRLPLEFLRGCGLSDPVIDYLPSLISPSPIQFYSCFISYATANQDFATRLHADLQNNGVRCWFAPHDMQPGKKIHQQIDEAIRVYDRLLLILSNESVKSEWVATEISKARRKEASQNRRVLFPISLVPYEQIRDWELFDADRGKDSAREIREYYIPDFSPWKTDHDSYAKAFDALLKALKSADTAAAASS